MQLRWVHANEALPDPANALDEPLGLLCAGMDLSAPRLIEAYKAGLIKAIWKVAGKYEVVAVMEVDSGDDLDAIVHNLPYG